MMKQMEEKLESEKLAIKKQYERERVRIQQQAEIHEEEKKKLLEELKQKEDVQSKEKSKQ